MDNYQTRKIILINRQVKLFFRYLYNYMFMSFRIIKLYNITKSKDNAIFCVEIDYNF